MNLLALVSDAFGGQGGIAQYNRDLLNALSAAEPGNRILVMPRHGRARARVPAMIAIRALPHSAAMSRPKPNRSG